MSKKTNATKWICIEGGDGTFKSTTTAKLVEALTAAGYKVLYTKEPGVDHLPITMTLRDLALNSKHAEFVNDAARSHLMQAIREIHQSALIQRHGHEYDYIIQDRGILSGHIYERANRPSDAIFIPKLHTMRYDKIFILRNHLGGVGVARDAKVEFSGGVDVIEARDTRFHDTVDKLFYTFAQMTQKDGFVLDPDQSCMFSNSRSIDVELLNVLDDQDIPLSSEELVRKIMLGL